MSKKSAVGRRVGVIGLGAIGGGAARCLGKAGFEVTVTDIRPGAAEDLGIPVTVAAKPSELAAACTVAVVAVVDDAQVRAVVTGPEGILQSASPCDVVILSTVSPATVRAVAGSASTLGVGVVDCGVSGGPSAAAAGELVCMVGGEPDALARVHPYIEAFSSLILPMGGPGAGISAKLARNLIQYGSWLAAYEGQRLAEAAGIDLSLLARAVRESDKLIGGPATLMFRSTVEPLGSDETALFEAMSNAAGLASKDLRAARELAAELGIQLPLAEMVEQRCEAVFGLDEDVVTTRRKELR